MTDISDEQILDCFVRTKADGQKAYMVAVGRAVLALQPSTSAGWKLVPIEPTAEMCSAARAVPEPVKPYPQHFHLIWDAMIAASPSPVTAAREQEGRMPIPKDENEARLMVKLGSMYLNGTTKSGEGE
jgi:hypothetical protein